MKKFIVLIYLSYLRFFARLQLKKINPVIIGIGGASGKTSLVSFVFLILSQKYKVRQGKGKNSETGIPLSILDIQPKNFRFIDWLKIAILCPTRLITNWEKYDYLISEMGIDSPFPPKNMEYLLKIVKPHIGVLTNINIEHSLYFDPLVKEEKESERKAEILRQTAKQEGLLLKSISSSGISFVNIDDPKISELLPLRSKIVTVSAKDKNADFYIRNVRISEASFTVEFGFLSEKYQVSISNPLPKYFSYSIVFAIAIAFSCGFSIKEVIKILEEKFVLPSGRFSVFRGIKDTIIIDSSYNSSYEPTKGALEALSAIGQNRRKVGILGDMREMGSISKIQHELLAQEIVKNLDFAILIGPAMREFVSPVLEKANFNFRYFETFREAKDEILDLIKQNDVVLVKGSQNTLFLERVVELLLADKLERDKLCRRGKYWNQVRNKAS